MILENAIIFKSKKGNRKNESKENNIYFSICKSSKGYESITFYIGSNIARKVKINEQTRLEFACDREDKTIWYLIAGTTGYSVKKDKSGTSYKSHMNFPFTYIDIKMHCVAEKNIEINSDKRIITFFVFNILDNAKLLLKQEELK